MQINVQMTGDREAIARLKRIGNGVLHLKPSMDEIGSYLTGFFSGEVFASRGGVIGEPWARLSARYAARKAKEFPGRIPLVRTGLMNRSFKKDAGQMSVLLYNSSNHFDFHQLGTSKMPARAMMKVDAARQQRIVKIIDNHISELTA